MNGILQNLLKLQEVEFGEEAEKHKTQAAKLRASIPAPILGHYDRLRARGKKGIALVRNQVCGGCHMGVPIGMIATMMKGEGIQLCGSCGRYLCLPEPAEGEVLDHMAVPKLVVKPRKRKTAATVA
jgi:predicted  nucleic acid-binding Zn-ribbon protein